MPLPYCVYVIQSLKDQENYTGFTTDLYRRLYEHNAGKSRSTAPRRPFILVYCEFHRSKSDTIRRERYFKTTIGKKAVKLMTRDTRRFMDLGEFNQISSTDLGLTGKQLTRLVPP